MRRLFLVLLLAASLIVGVVIGRTMVGYIEFSYRIVDEGVTLTPNPIHIELGDLKPGSLGDGGMAKGVATLFTGGAEITLLLGGNLSSFDMFNITISFYQGDLKTQTVEVSMTNPEVSFTLIAGTYELSLGYTWHVKTDAQVGTEGKVYLSVTYQE